MLKDILTCQICFEEFDLEDQGKKPLSIALCGHTFCFNCMKTIIIQKACPICRQPHHLKSDQIGGSGISRNFLFEEVIANKNQLKPAKLESVKSEESSQQQIEQDRFLCLDCCTDFEAADLQRANSLHLLHRWLELSEVDSETAKQIWWVFNLVKTRDCQFLGTKIFIHALQEYINSVSALLERIEAQLCPGGSSPKVDIFERLQEDLIRTYLISDEIDEPVKNPRLITDLCQLWEFEVKNSLKITEFIKSVNAPISAELSDFHIQELRHDWDKFHSVGFSKSSLSFLELACVSTIVQDASSENHIRLTGAPRGIASRLKRELQVKEEPSAAVVPGAEVGHEGSQDSHKIKRDLYSDDDSVLWVKPKLELKARVKQENEEQSKSEGDIKAEEDGEELKDELVLWSLGLSCIQEAYKYIEKAAGLFLPSRFRTTLNRLVTMTQKEVSKIQRQNQKADLLRANFLGKRENQFSNLL